MIEAKTMGEIATFDGEYVTITRSRISYHGRGETRLHISQISAVRWKPAGMFAGHIQFSVPGAVTEKTGGSSQTVSAARDPHAITFSKKQQSKFEELRAAVEAAIASRHAPAAGASAGEPLADQLAKLHALHQQGVLSLEEFTAAKARLLGS